MESCYFFSGIIIEAKAGVNLNLGIENEIYNPGTFPEGLDPQDFIERAERSIRRNPKIARILKEMVVENILIVEGERKIRKYFLNV